MIGRKFCQVIRRKIFERMTRGRICFSSNWKKGGFFSSGWKKDCFLGRISSDKERFDFEGTGGEIQCFFFFKRLEEKFF